MNFQELLNLFPLGGVLFVLGSTEIAYYIIKHSSLPKVPVWFVLIPVTCGALYSIFNFLSEYSEEFIALPFYVKFARVAIQGFVGIGISMLIFEGRKRITKMIIGKYFPKGQVSKEKENGNSEQKDT